MLIEAKTLSEEAARSVGPKLETDYLIVGGGAAAMAFVDTLLEETEHRIVVVDRRHQPGGHWNDAYPFVRLHAPAALYGVGSRELGRRVTDRTGPNAGLYELASKDEILDYYDQVLRTRFLPSGRVTWLSMSEYARQPDGRHIVRSLVNGSEQEVVVKRKLVDATLARPEIPATRPPRYTVAPRVQHVPVNGLTEIRRPYPCYTVVGAGKTGMDACLWLLANGVGPGRIRWIMPRDHWMINRAGVQPYAENFERTTQNTLNQFDAIIEATTPSQLFELLEADGVLMRLDPAVETRTYHCATVSPDELEQLRRIRDVVRLGRVTKIETERIVLEDGAVEADPDTLYIDCSASAIQPMPDVAVFEPGTVNLTTVRWCQPIFSAALIAFVESRFDDDDEKNAICGIVPLPDVPLDWLTMWQVTLANAHEWERRPEVADWVARCRLDWTNASLRDVDPADPRRGQLADILHVKAADAAEKIPHLVAQLPSGNRS